MELEPSHVRGRAQQRTGGAQEQQQNQEEPVQRRRKKAKTTKKTGNERLWIVRHHIEGSEVVS